MMDFRCRSTSRTGPILFGNFHVEFPRCLAERCGTCRMLDPSAYSSKQRGLSTTFVADLLCLYGKCCLACMESTVMLCHAFRSFNLLKCSVEHWLKTRARSGDSVCNLGGHAMQDRIVARMQRETACGPSVCFSIGCHFRGITKIALGLYLIQSSFGIDCRHDCKVLAGLPPDLKGPELMRLFENFNAQAALWNVEEWRNSELLGWETSQVWFVFVGPFGWIWPSRSLNLLGCSSIVKNTV